jgi:hypothetical protein
MHAEALPPISPRSHMQSSFNQTPTQQRYAHVGDTCYTPVPEALLQSTFTKSSTLIMSSVLAVTFPGEQSIYA